MQENLQSSVDFLQRLLLVAVVLILVLLFVNYYWSSLANAEALVRELCQKQQQESSESGPDHIAVPLEEDIVVTQADPVASEL